MGRVGARSSPPPSPQPPSPSITSLGKYLLPPHPPCRQLPAVSCSFPAAKLQGVDKAPRSLWRSGGLRPPHSSLGSGSSGTFSPPLRVSPPSSCAVSPSCLTSFLLSFLSPSPPPFLGLSPWESALTTPFYSLTFSILSCHPSYLVFHFPPSCFTSASLPSFPLTTSSILSPSLSLALGSQELALNLPLFPSTAQEVLGLQGHPSQGPDEAAGCWGGPQG